MRIRRTFLGLLFAAISFSAPALAADRAPEPNAALTNAITKLDREAVAGADGPGFLAGLIQREFGTRAEEMEWGLEQELTWGEITALAYIQAATGKTFAEMTQEDARRDFWSYAENAGMSCEKMVRSLETFIRRAEKERNSSIFDRLRASRRVHALPDLGSGFGLFQEALDFRRIEQPRPTKIHDGPGLLTKREK